MILQNIEGEAGFNIRADWHAGREPGISAFVRLKDEADFAVAALESIAPWCHEIVIALQGIQSDGTGALVRAWAEGRETVRVVYWPWDSVPNGPGHGDQARGSVRERAYFYNWCLAQTRFSHALKWDGDMVLLPEYGPRLQGLFRDFDGAKFDGIELTRGPAGFHLSKTHPRTAPDTRLFRVTPATYYETGPLCEVPSFGPAAYFEPKPADHLDIVIAQGPFYLHFKWTKPLASITKAWPADWHRHRHFRALLERAEPGTAYGDALPAELRAA